MDISFDSTWCPVCSRQIVPKRTLVPVPPPQPAATPAPPPSSPSSEPKKQSSDAPAAAPAVRRAKTVRARGGLVHGTGRVKPNGTIKRIDSSKESAKRSPPPAAPTTAVTTAATVAPPQQRMRTVIDQTPAPLYCSDECRLIDLQSTHGALNIKFNPERCASPILPPVPHNSYSDVSGPEDTDSSSGASVESRTGVLSPVNATATTNTAARALPAASAAPSIAPATGGDKHASRAYAALQALYDLPPPPPPPPLLPEPEKSKETRPRNDYQSGIMMAAQRIKAALCPEPPKATGFNSDPVRPPVGPIPGWTDGSHAWRASVYSLASPNEVPLPGEEDKLPRAYRGFVASPHRARGVTSTLSSDSSDLPTLQKLASTSSFPPKASRAQSETAELYSKFHATLSRRCESRASLQYGAPGTSLTGSTRSLPQARREVPLVKPGAEGMLLVPDVKMRRTASTASVDLVRSPLSYASLTTPGARRKRSPLSRQGSATSFATSVSGGGSSRSAGSMSGSVDTIGEEDETMRMHSSRSAPMRTRLSQTAPPAWRYTDTLTYDIMPMPREKQKRVETRIVDGELREVEVEVEVEEPRKRLFLFPSKDEVDSVKPRRRHQYH
ncbi:hypothetical protein OBBRIDRAFT_117504 [Obba rivulosa]|uniref:Uncharacterized protein n=1 Tax=Obba rivulosa TaxID=1052685 RepID=A0A8E2DI93_9APHY|nr:hypothetical protein OBBRIDRAFT_117504 [Obba rivulosa]